MSDNFSAGNIPSIRSFQMDKSGAGVIKNSVNLFRGDVNYTQMLLSLPGRTQGDGLDVTIAIQYQSNIHQESVTWNRDAPTDVVGMGWTLPLPVIRLDSEAPTPGAARFTIVSNGIPSSLVQEMILPLLFSMDSALSSQLVNGLVVPPDVRAQFVNRGLPLSTQAVVYTTGAGAWRIQDDQWEQEYLLSSGADALEVRDGGQVYQVASYNFWKVVYYPRYERWQVTDNSGLTTSYGGGVGSENGTATSDGESIEWGVLWMDQDGTPLWMGNSIQADGQQQYATAWHLARAYSRSGEYVRYAYTQVQQAVGAGGKPYTKACYLSSITDVFGRRFSFTYQPKRYDDDCQEYLDPYKTTPNDDPDGFQSCYETSYLYNIEAFDSGGALRMVLWFEYQLANFVAGEPADCGKRLLTGVYMVNANGDGLPGFRYDYYLDPDEQTNVGALKSIHWPSGGVATYTYTPVSLDICDRSISLSPPSPLPDSSVPRVWFGDAYAVVMWSNTDTGDLSLQIMTWKGGWWEWTPQSSSALLAKTTNLDPQSLDVTCGSGFVAVQYTDGSQTNVFLFRQSAARTEQWSLVALDGPSPSPPAPTLTYQASSGTVDVMAGQCFLLVTQTNPSGYAMDYKVLTWSWASQCWSVADNSIAAASNNYVWFVSGQDYYATCDMAGNITLSYLTPDGIWGQSTTTLGSVQIAKISNLALASDASTIAIVNLTSQMATRQTYDVYLLQWNANYAFINPNSPAKFTFTDYLNQQHPTGFQPVIVDNTLVAIAGNVLRFDGAAWQSSTTLSPSASSNNDIERRFAYGADLAVVINAPATSGTATAQLLNYDADAEPASAYASDAPAVAGSTQATDNWPSCGEDTLILGTNLYFRGTSTDWTQVVNPGAPTDLEALLTDDATSYTINAQSFLNESTQFIACSVYTGSSTACAVFILQNEGVAQQQVLTDQKMWTAAEGDTCTGVYPGGESMFCTYPSSATSFDDATTIYINYYAANAIEGNISHWPVTQIEIDDGMSESSTTTYAPDYKTATCDPSGDVVQYGTTTVYPGGTPESPQNGSVTVSYINLEAGASSEDYCDCMNGLLDSVVISDADQVASGSGDFVVKLTKQWQAYTQRAGDPSDGSVPVRQLFGAYVVESERDIVKDGVPSAQIQQYVPAGLPCPYTGQIARIESTVLNGAGQEETIIQYSTYACEVDDSSQVENDLTTKVAGRVTSTVGGVTTTLMASATPLAGWPSVFGNDVLVPRSQATLGWLGGGDGTFPFDDFDPAAPPSSWQVGSQVTQYAPNGSVLMQSDGVGTVQSTVHALSSAMPVITYQGAALPECAYSNFQAYEDASAWTLQGTSFDVDNAWLGTRSLCLPTGASVSTAVTPAAGRDRYLLAFRYQTPAGYTAQAGSGLQIDGAPGFVPFADTQGQWTYVTTVLAVTEGTSQITVQGTNQSPQTVWLDSVLLLPWGAMISATSLHDDLQLVRASMTAGGVTTFTLYDQAQRVLGTVGGDGELQELDVRYLSLQGSADFDDASPNAELTLQAAGGGTAETFRDNGAWAQRWAPQTSTLWQASNGCLVKSGTQADSLVWQGDGRALTTAAFFVELSLPAGAEVGSGIGLSYYDESLSNWQSIVWSSSGWNADGAPALASPSSFALQWLLVMGAGRIAFFANGQLIFSYPSSAVPQSGGLKILTEGNVLTIHQLVVAYAPSLAVFYTDGAARQRQTQQLHGSDARVAEAIYDGLDRLIAKTRTAPASFGKGAAMSPLQYRDTFVDVDAFLAHWGEDGVMSGDVADYYAFGHRDGTLPRSDDRGYSYTGSLRDGSALGRMSECGQPGRDHAVNLQNPNRGTAKAIYASSQAGDPVAAGQYTVQGMIAPGGAVCKMFIDTYNRPVASQQSPPSKAADLQTSLASTYFNNGPGDAGMTASLRLPNYYDGSLQGAESFVRETVANPLTQVTSIQEPSAGTTQLIYDANGRLRFTQVPLELGENYYLYTRYDCLGRTVEEGTVNATWDEDVLSARADDLAFPSASDGAVAARQYGYDGDGTNPGDIGCLTQVITFNPDDVAGACTVTEQWSYDALSRVASSTLTLSGAVTCTVQVTYQYNALNQITQIDYLSPALGSLSYSYDDQGQIVSITSSAVSIDYKWTADSQLQSVGRGSLIDAFAYDSTGDVVTHEVRLGERIVFEQSYKHDLDSKTTFRQTSFAFREHVATSNEAFSYNDQQWLWSAKDTHTTLLAIDGFDANGNIWSWQQGAVAYAATAVQGTDRLQSVNAGGTPLDFQYRNDGNPSQWRGLSIGYDPALSTTASIEDPAAGVHVRYARGLANNRVLRQEGENVRVCFFGPGAVPILTLDNGVPSICIWGSNGLDAVMRAPPGKSESVYFPVKDPVGSVWAVVDDQGGLTAAFEYHAFGQVRSVAGSDPGNWLLRFGGKEWDASLGLYDFDARMYDPALLRFLGPDAAHQFASPYVFAGNNPLDMTDPSGNMSVIDRVLIGLGVAAATTLAVVACPEAIDFIVEADVETGDLVVGGAEEGMEQGGKDATQKTAVSIAKNTITTSITTAGINGVNYDMHCGRDFSTQAFFKTMGFGAVSGATKGLFSGFLGVPIDEFSKDLSVADKVGWRLLGYTAAYITATVVNTLLLDAVEQRMPTGQQMAIAMARGILGGVYNGAVDVVPSIPEMTGGTPLNSYVLGGSPTAQQFVLAGASVAFGTAVMAGYTTLNHNAQMGSSSTG